MRRRWSERFPPTFKWSEPKASDNRWLSHINPMSHYLVVIRGTFLKGVGLSVLWPQMPALAALGVALLTTSALRFASHWIDRR